MKEKVCVWVFVLSALAVLGIISGIECGQPSKNVWACLIPFAVMYVSYKIGFKEY